VPNTCHFCAKPTKPGHNYCDWDCHVADAKRIGGKVKCPNGLRIACIKHNGDMLEHEHGDHPDYKFPVTVEYHGTDFERAEVQLAIYGKLLTPAELLRSRDQVHALIYTDGTIAVTMYECCYATWFINQSSVSRVVGNLWERGEWALSAASRTKISDLYNGSRGH